MRKLGCVLVIGILAVSACSSSSKSSASGVGGDVLNNGYSSSGSAQVSIEGSSVTLTPGGCRSESGKTVFQAGDSVKMEGDWIQVIVYQHGDTFEMGAVTGSVNGKPFISGSGIQGTFGSDGTGSFTGSDFLTTVTGPISGTFSCQ